MTPDGRSRVALLVVLVTAEAAVHAAGVTFDATMIEGAWQLLDPELLRDDLLRSIWYLHSQPPLFNLLVGLVLKVSGPFTAAVLHVAFVLLGWSLSFGMMWLARALGASVRMALLAAALFAVSPALLMYEHWFFYSLPEAALVMLCVTSGVIAARQQTSTAVALFLVSTATLCLMRSLFHLVFSVAVVVALGWSAPPLRRQLRLWGTAMVVVVALWYAKNAVMFGSFTSSTWLGMNLAKMTVGYLAPANREHMEADGLLSPVSSYEAFSPVEWYEAVLGPMTPWKGPAAIAAIHKSNGSPNMNYGGLIGLSEIYRHDSLEVLRRYPSTYLRAVRDAWWIFFWTDTAQTPLVPNLDRIGVWDRLWNRVLLGVLDRSPTAWTVVVGFLLSILWATVLVWRADTSDVRSAALLAGLCIVYVAAVGNLLEMGENNRFRFAIDAVTVALLASLGSRVAGWRAGSRERRGAIVANMR